MVSVTCNIKHNIIVLMMNSFVCVNDSYDIYLIEGCMVIEHLMINNIIVLIININVIND